MASSWEARLIHLEANDKVKTRDILRLKKDVVELQTTVYDLKEENAQKLQEMETQLRQMRNVLTDVCGFKDDIVSRLDCLESSVNRLVDNHDRVSRLETAVNESRQEVAKCRKLVADKTDVFEWKRRKQMPLHEDFDEEETQVKTKQGMSKSNRFKSLEKTSGASEKDETMVKTVVDVTNVWREESTKPGMSLVADRLDNIEKQTQENRDSIILLHKIKESAIQVHLKPSQGLITGRIVKLDTCEWVSTNVESFDVTSCCLQPGIDGDYAVNFTFVQADDGEVMMWAKSDEWTNEFYLGKTVSDNDVSSIVHVFSLRKGQKIWLEACRSKGNARTAGCYLYCWLLEPWNPQFNN